MKQDQRLYIVIIAAGVLAILISTCFGAFAGGIAGYWAGRKVSKRVTEEYLPSLQDWRREPIEPQEPSPFPPERFPFMPEVGGALVTEVVEESPADRAGIQPGDLILAVDGVRLEDEDTLIRVIRRHRPGDRAEITLWSRGRQRTISVRLGEHPDDKEAPYLGVYYQMLPMGMEAPGMD